MIDKSIIAATTSWPFVEARKLVRDRKNIFESKGYFKIFEIQHNKTLLYLYFTDEI